MPAITGRGYVMRKGSGGFTLIELMIAVVIIGVLAAIALPAYDGYVVRSNRTVAKTVIMKIAGHQESYFNDRKAYAATLNAISSEYPAATVYVGTDGRLSASNTTNAIYSVTLGAYTAATVANCTVAGTPSAVQYAIIATPINRQTRDTSCGSLCYGSVGDRGVSVSGGTSECWRR